ncbi:MAG: glycosyltransferase family 4 protein [Rhodoferax sp.]|nr:glycosyltransferase family 4 protein [Rhodoferax sp.]
MKVVHVVRQYTPSIGGMEEVVRNLALQQQAAGDCQPSVITLDKVFRESHHRLLQTETIDRVPVHRLAFCGSERYPLCPQVLGTLGRADVVHVHGIDFFFDFLAWTQVIHRKRLIASTHGGFFHTEFASRLKKIYFRSVTRLSALSYRRIIATSENDGDMFHAVVNPERLRVIENGVDVEKFANTASKTLTPTLIYFGRWSVNKGILDVLDVFVDLCAQQPEVPWHLVIAGRAYDLNAEAIRIEADRRGIGEQRLQIIAGPSNDVLRQQIARSSYFVCLSHHEGFGIAPIEGMSAGLIPVLSTIAPFQRLVANSGTGLLLDTATTREKAQQIAQLHDGYVQEPQKHSVDRAYVQTAAKAYSWKDVAARYTQQYEHVLDSP